MAGKSRQSYSQRAHRFATRTIQLLSANPLALLLFVENLDCDCAFITRHTIGGANLTGPDFLGRKERIVAPLRDQIEHGDLDRMARVRATKASL